MIERHHDYVLGPNQDSRLATVAAGQTIEGLTLGLDPDAPFLLRSRALRIQYDASRTQSGLETLLMRWTGPNRDYRSQDFVRQNLYGPYFGQLGNPLPVSPQVFYPGQGQIVVDIRNSGTAALTNLTLYFRGVKLYQPGAVKSYSYPARFATLPYTYPVTFASLPVTSGIVRRTLAVKTDADFVLRSGQCGLPFSTTPVNEVFVRLRDEDEKPYSNDFVHMDVLFGNSGFGFNGAAPFPQGRTTVAPVGTGPNSPGLFYPEIYVPKNHVLYVEALRTDVSFAGAVAVNLPIAFGGMKVFEK